MTVCGDRAFTELTELKQGHMGGALIQSDGVLLRGGNLDVVGTRDARTRRKNHVRSQWEDGQPKREAEEKPVLPAS